MNDQSKEEQIYAKSIMDFYNDNPNKNIDSPNHNLYKKNFLKYLGQQNYLEKHTNPILLKFESDTLSPQEQTQYETYTQTLFKKNNSVTKELDDKLNYLHIQRSIKPCPPNKIRNPNTGRCITLKQEKINSDTKIKQKKEPKPCPPGKIRNITTGRCITPKQLLPELLSDNTNIPIIIQKPQVKQDKFALKNIPTKSFNKNTFKVMLAKNYTSDIDPTEYYLSEKLDGIRAIYHNNEFISRTNKIFNVPVWFTEHYPTDVVFDGELFTKRKDFKGVMSTVTKKIPIDSEWENVVYMVFDLPTVKLPFEERYELLKHIVDEINISGNMRINYVNQHQIKNRKELDEIHKELTLKGAEGTMLRKPQSSYENTRSSSLLKYKDFIDDEVIVEGFELGDGRNTNRMGNLIVKWLHPGEKDSEGHSKTSDSFSVGSGFDDEQRNNYKNLFPKGTIIKIKYGELQSSGKPRFPTYVATIPSQFAH